MHDSKLAEMWQSAHYRERVAMVERMRPLVPPFQYKGESNIEEIKYRLAQASMFEAILALLKPTEV